MLHRIRKAMQNGSMMKLGATKDKVAVMGLLERGGEVRVSVVSSPRKHGLQAEVRNHVEAGAALYVDALLSDEGLVSDYAHKIVDHAVEYVSMSTVVSTPTNLITSGRCSSAVLMELTWALNRSFVSLQIATRNTPEAAAVFG